jgi:hypothetical protein
MADFWFLYINEHRRNIDLEISNLLLLTPARRTFSTRFGLRFTILILVAVTIGFALGLYLLTYRLGCFVAAPILAAVDAAKQICHRRWPDDVP